MSRTFTLLLATAATLHGCGGDESTADSSKLALQAGDTQVEGHFVFADTSDVEDLKGMSVTGLIKFGEEQHPDPEAVVTFEAQKDKQEDLKKVLQDIINKISESQPLPGAFEVKLNSDDKVDVVWDCQCNSSFDPSQSGSPNFTDIGKPSFNLDAKCGRSFSEMFEQRNKSLVTVPGGISVTFSVALVKLVLQMISEQEALSGSADSFGMLMLFKHISASANFIYESETKVNEQALKMGVLSFQSAMQGAGNALTSLPRDLQELLMPLPDVAAGLVGVSLRKFPKNLEVDIEFVNFRPSLVLKQILIGGT